MVKIFFSLHFFKRLNRSKTPFIKCRCLHLWDPLRKNKEKIQISKFRNWQMVFLCRRSGIVFRVCSKLKESALTLSEILIQYINTKMSCNWWIILKRAQIEFEKNKQSPILIFFRRGDGGGGRTYLRLNKRFPIPCSMANSHPLKTPWPPN